MSDLNKLLKESDPWGIDIHIDLNPVYNSSNLNSFNQLMNRQSNIQKALETIFNDFEMLNINSQYLNPNYLSPFLVTVPNHVLEHASDSSYLPLQKHLNSKLNGKWVNGLSDLSHAINQLVDFYEKQNPYLIAVKFEL